MERILEVLAILVLKEIETMLEASGVLVLILNVLEKVLETFSVLFWNKFGVLKLYLRTNLKTLYIPGVLFLKEFEGTNLGVFSILFLKKVLKDHEVIGF